MPAGGDSDPMGIVGEMLGCIIIAAALLLVVAGVLIGKAL